MKSQFELARSFLRQVIDKGRHLHDSDGEGLSDDEPGEPLLHGLRALLLDIPLLLQCRAYSAFAIGCDSACGWCASQRGSYEGPPPANGPTGKRFSSLPQNRSSCNALNLPTQVAGKGHQQAKGPATVPAVRLSEEGLLHPQRTGRALLVLQITSSGPLSTLAEAFSLGPYHFLPLV